MPRGPVLQEVVQPLGEVEGGTVREAVHLSCCLVSLGVPRADVLTYPGTELRGHLLSHRVELQQKMIFLTKSLIKGLNC